MKKNFIKKFNKVGIEDVGEVGGKNASLGEMIRNLAPKGVKIPGGFVVTATAYRHFLRETGLEKFIKKTLSGLNTKNLKDLARRGKIIREAIKKAEFPKDLEKEIIKAYWAMEGEYGKNVDVAVRSSATAEDLPSISENEFVLAKFDNRIVFRPVKEIYEFSKLHNKIDVLSLDDDYKIKWHQAEEIYKHPAFGKELIKIITKSGREITITPDHSLLILDPDDFRLKIINSEHINGKAIIPTTLKISKPLLFSINNDLDIKKILRNRFLIKEKGRLKIKASANYVIQNDFPATLKIDDDLAYFLGLYISEGSVYEKKSTIDISCESEILASRVRIYLEQLGLKPRGKKNIRIHNKVLSELLKELCGMPLNNVKGKGRSARIKQVPEFIFSQLTHIVGSFLRGCFDGDGYISRESIEYVSASEKLINGLAVLCQMLGIKVYLRRKRRYFYLVIPYDQAVLFKEQIGFSEARQSKRLNRLIAYFESKLKHQDFIDVLPASRFINKHLEAALKKKLLNFEKKSIILCPQCSYPSIKHSNYYSVSSERKIQRYYCNNCDYNFSERSCFANRGLETALIEVPANTRDENGRFFAGFSPWNKGNRKQLQTLGKKYFQTLLQEAGNNSDILKKIVDSDVIWDRIEKIEKIKYSGYVYDFVVPSTQNFIAGFGGVITHNTASFAGEHETFLNIRGADEVLKAVKAAMASLFTDRAISYRVDKGFDHFKIALSVGAQKMVRSDKACSGVMFTLDTESGFRDVVLINGSWGLGEMIVQGEVTPDEFLIFKPLINADKKRIYADKDETSASIGRNQRKSTFIPIIDKKLGIKNRKMVYSEGKDVSVKNTKIILTSQKEKETFVLSDKEILQLAKWGVLIEEHYSKKAGKWAPMDIEWAKDGQTGELFIVQARPETVHALRDFSKIKEYVLDNSKFKIQNSKFIVKGASVGSKIAVGKARIILEAKNIGQFKAGEVLITDMTDPDWEPIMKIASAIVTDKGGRISHAAIVSRELGIPCIVGTGNATRKIKTGQTITVDTTGAEGFVYDGALKFRIVEQDVKKFPKPKIKVMMNIATPETAFEKSFLPNDGVGLAREEFIIAGDIGIHPMALINFDKLKSEIRNPKSETNSKFKIQNSKLKYIVNEIEKRTIGYKDKTRFYIDKLAYGIAKIGAAFYPKLVILRFSDFKTNEYRTLIGGELYEPQEENPMIGWRGASRYYHPNFKEAFILELKAIKKVREEMGLDNVAVMVPFCRTPEEGRKVLEIMRQNGLIGINQRNRHKSALKIFVMCEIPSNVILADEFLDVFDGMSIGSNDLTQLTVGIDRDGNEMIRNITNENNASVKKFISEVVKKCRSRKKYIGICGQAPSDIPGFAEFLVKQGIESISLNPDTIIKTTQKIYEKEKRRKK